MKCKTSLEIDGVKYVMMPEMRNGMICWRQIR